MKDFDTYHWQGVRLKDTHLEAARLELASPTSGEAVMRSFANLLRSGNTAAIGIALDHYHYAVSGQRHGIVNHLAEHAVEVEEAARHLLRQPPTPSEITGSEIDGADHASALLIMMNKATPEDSELILHAIDQAPGFDVASAAFAAAGRILEYADAPNQVLIDTLTRVVFDESRDPDERLEALQALARGSAPQVLSEVARVAELEDLSLQVTAIHALGFHDMARYRSLVEERSASWPEDTPYPAFDVQRLLRENESQGE